MALSWEEGLAVFWVMGISAAMLSILALIRQLNGLFDGKFDTPAHNKIPPCPTNE